MQNQEIAALEWFVAMGVDEWVEDKPQNRFQSMASHAAAPSASATVASLDSTVTTTSNAGSAITADEVANIMGDLSARGLQSDASNLPFSPAVMSQPTAISQDVSEAASQLSNLASKASTITELRDIVKEFQGLSICKSATQGILSEGVVAPKLLVIGEAPGAEEDREGRPFCGPSGQLLDKMLAAIGFDRTENCAITHSVFWRPPGNRTPTAEEIAACAPIVMRQIELLKPKLVMLCGAVAISSVLQDNHTIAKLRKGVHHLPQDPDIPVFVTYHPSYLLRQPSQKKLAWQDLLRIKATAK